MHDASYREQLLAHNAYNREIYNRVHQEAVAGRGVPFEDLGLVNALAQIR